MKNRLEFDSSRFLLMTESTRNAFFDQRAGLAMPGAIVRSPPAATTMTNTCSSRSLKWYTLCITNFSLLICCKGMAVRKFSNICNRMGLKEFFESTRGTLYFVPNVRIADMRMVRHFDSQLGPEMVGPYAAFLAACQKWVESDPTLGNLVWVAQALEIGSDFLLRIHYPYGNSSDCYLDDDIDGPREAPPEFEKMRNAVLARPPERDAYGQGS